MASTLSVTKLPAIAQTTTSLAPGFKTYIDGKQKTTKLSDLVKGLADATRRIQLKAIASKGIGSPIGDVEYGAGKEDGYVQRFQNGAIYMKPPGGPCFVHGSILQKYIALGAEAGFLGYPTTDELGTHNGSGRYNHFEHGSIYWTYATGAQEVHGAIRDRWAALGWEQSWLGFPRTDETAFPDNGRASVFENGTIFWWPDTGAIDLGNVAVRYKGLYAFGITDGVGSDNPYVIFGAASAAPDSGVALRTEIYSDVDAGDERPGNMVLFTGPPVGMGLAFSLWEHDSGDPDKYLPQVKQGVDLVGKGVAAGCGIVFGPEAAPICEGLWSSVSKELADIVNDLLGTGDDLLGSWSRPISTKELVTLARLPPSHFWGIQYHLESSLLSKDGGIVQGLLRRRPGVGSTVSERA